MSYDRGNYLQVIDTIVQVGSAPPSIVTRIRPSPRHDAVAYAIALRLHTCLNLDALLSDIDLMALGPVELRSLLGGISRATGVACGAEFDAKPEEGD